MKALYHRYLKVIDRYIIRKYLGTFAFTLGIFIVVSVVFDISEHLDNFLSHHATFSQVAFQYYAGFVPFYMNYLSPLINFLAVIFFTAKMANQTEIVPILSGKASFNRFLRPYFISSSLIFVVSLFANVYLIPYTNDLKVKFENSHGFNGDPSKNEVHLQLDKQTYVYVQTYDPVSHTGFQFVLEKFRGDTMRQRIIANTVTYDSLRKVWTLRNYSVRYINGLREKLVQNIQQKDTTLDLRPGDFIVHDNVYS